jgi:pimeloyl-ACP methyl ester carboxylesterase
MITERHVTLADGRLVSYSDSGPRDGRVVLLCHGLPGARVQVPSTTILEQHHMRVLIIERPGIGLSSPQSVRTLADWSADVLAVLAAAQVETLTLVGYSAGTPYALTFASLYPERVTHIYIVSGMAPSAAEDIAKLSIMNRWLHSMGNTLPPTARRALAWTAATFIGTGTKAAAFGIKMMRSAFTPAENSYIDTPDGAVFRAMLAESFRQGYDGYLVDLGLVTKHWPISYDRIHHPVHAWYGSDDRITPPTAAVSLQAVLPQTTVTITPGAGHLMIFMAWDELVSRIANEA